MVDHVTSCDLVAPHGFIVYAESTAQQFGTAGSLHMIPIGATSAYQITLVPDLYNPVAVEYYHHTDSYNGYIFWSDPENAYIGRASFDGSNPVRIVEDVKTDSLAVDWISGNIYWVDYQLVHNTRGDIIGLDKFTISVSRLDGRYRKKLITSRLDVPRGIAVLPKQGYVVTATKCRLHCVICTGRYSGMILNIVMLVLRQPIWMVLVEKLLFN